MRHAPARSLFRPSRGTLLAAGLAVATPLLSTAAHAEAPAARQGYWVGAAHLSFPGIGHLRAEGKGYTFVPVNYQSLK